ncbi:MAG: transglutaminase N-terminal domain-containing protein [Leptospirales bacterium]
MNRYHIVHKTTYKYQKAVTLSHNEGHLLPCDDEHQTCESASLRVQPEPAVIHERTDIYGNRVNYFSLEQPHKIIEVVAESWIRRQVTDRIPLDPDVRAAAARNSPSWETVRDNLSGLSDDAMIQ